MKLTADDIRKNYEFDAVGITRHEEKTIILLGIETEPDKNLDEFIGGDGKYETWCFSGFKKYFSPVLDRFLVDFEKIDKEAKPLEGYDKSIKIKQLAVKAGMGIQGRNTLIINEIFQSRLRFLAVQTTLEIEPTGNGYYSKEKNVRCDDCRLCELVCPVEALKDYKLPVPALCLAHIQLTNRKPNLVRCNLCWRACTKDLYWAKQKRLARDAIIKMMRPEYENMYDQ